MRAINLKHRKQTRVRKRRKWPIFLALVVTFSVVACGAYMALKPEAATNKSPALPQENIVHNQIPEIQKKGILKTFTGVEFRDLYNGFTYPNTKLINEKSPITGNELADNRIKQIALTRGYQIRSAPVSNTFRDVGNNQLLQHLAAESWGELLAAAKNDGINLDVTAGYRSAEDQKKIFLDRLNQLNISYDGIARGTNDAQVSHVLKTTAIPGYSRHHTGYTVDIGCMNTPNTSFMYTPCFKWLSDNNYQNAKTYGWIPSYPEGTDNQGPDPESWEYVWVGKDAITD